MDTLYIVMPAYNEEKNIEKVIRKWYPQLEDKSEESRLIIADSGSTDKTREIIKQMIKEFPKLKLLTDTEQYHGPKIIALYNYAIKCGAEYIFQTDSDDQTNPEEFHEFWELRKKYVGIFGSRNKRGDGKVRANVEKVVCGLLYLFFGVKVPDANAPFRLMKASTLEKYMNRIPRNYNIPNIILTMYFSYYNEDIIFVPISFKAREAGINSVNIIKIIKIGWHALGDFRRFKKSMI